MAASAVQRVIATDAARTLLEQLRAVHGELVIHQSGGCCDGSAPMCFPVADFRIGARDVRLGEVAGVEVYIGGAQYERWQHTQLIIDAVPGRGAGFSLETPSGLRFLARARVFSEEERAAARAIED